MRVLPIHEICERLNVCPLTARRLMQRGELPARKVGRRWYCTEAAVQEFLRPQAAPVRMHAPRTLQLAAV
jgi:excisionase family DNA binding protein